MKIRSLHLGVLVAAVACVSLATACSKGGSRKKSSAAKWVDSPSGGSKQGNVIQFADLGVKFNVPDTLYVYQACGEASHAPEGDHRWIPLITCSTVERDDEEYEGEAPEQLTMTVYVTHKTRPIDERSVAWFENQYKDAGLEVDEVSYNDNYQKKSGIYAKLQVVNPSSGLPTREIVQFMFPEQDVVFIAKMEYPFGESRSVDADWRYILWNFETGAGG